MSGSSSSETVSSAIDVHSELYIHHSDISNSFLLATQKLNGDNYGEWRRSAEITLSAKNKLGFVTGTCKKPTDGSSTLSYWERCNNMVISWILHSVESDIARSILYYNTASEIWTELEERYGQSNAPRKYQVHNHIASISQGNKSVSEFYTELKTSWDEYMSLISLPICTCGTGTKFLEILQEQQLLQFLLKLNDDYKTARGNILMRQPLPSLSQAYRLILQEEKQRECGGNVSFGIDSAAMAAPIHRNMTKPQFQSNKPKWNPATSGVQQQFPRPVQNHNFGIAPNGRRSRYFCENCKVHGHSIERCFKIHGFPADRGKKLVNAAHLNSPPTNDSSLSSGPSASSVTTSDTTITPEQYNHLLQLLNQSNFDADLSSGNSGSASALLAVCRGGVQHKLLNISGMT